MDNRTKRQEERERSRLIRRRFAILAIVLCTGDLVYTWLIIDPPRSNTAQLATAMRSFGSLMLLGWGIYEILAKGRTGWDAYTGQEVRLTLAGMGAVAIMIMLFVGSLIGRRNVMLLSAAMISGPFIVNGWLANVILRRIEVRRRLVDRTSAGDAIWVELELTNRKFWFACWLTTLRDEINSASESLDSEVVITRTAPRSTSSARYQLRPMRRGRYVLGPVMVRTRFPLGFVERRKLFDVNSVLLVRPRTGHLTSEWRRSRRRNETQVRVLALHEGSVDDEFQQLREYRPGDPTRKVHWRTSARRDELMIRDDRQAHAPPFTLLVDLWQPEEPTEADRERVELAVSFVATLCVDQLTRNRDSELRVGITGAETRNWVGRSGPAGIEALLDELAVVEAGRAEGFAEIAEELHRTSGPRISIVLVTTRPADEVRGAIGDLDPEVRRRVAAARLVEATTDSLASLFTIPEAIR